MESHFRKRKKSKERIWYTTPVLFVLLAIVVLVSRGVWGVWKKEQESRARLEHAEALQTDIHDRETFLQSEIVRLQTDEGIEEEIRERFGFVREGEQMIVVTDTESDQHIETKDPDTLWSKIKALFN